MNFANLLRKKIRSILLIFVEKQRKIYIFLFPVKLNIFLSRYNKRKSIFIWKVLDMQFKAIFFSAAVIGIWY